MEIISKLLAILFSIITALGIMPNTVPRPVTLDNIDKEKIVAQTELFGLSYAEGRFSLSFNGNTMFADAVSEFKAGNEIISSADYDSFSLEKEGVTDSRGSGTKLTVTLEADAIPTMKQYFTFYENESYFLMNVELLAAQGEVASNYIAPMVVRDGKIQNISPRWTNFLKVPFDNDSWVTFETANLMESALSHEVGAFFTPDKGNGFVIGSVTHDMWKSAVSYKNKADTVNELYVYSGANTALTRDQAPHGTVKGESISSATFLFGFYENWKDGMREYAKINTTFTPKRASVTESNPIGWNSWGSIQDKINYESAIATSDYIKENLQDAWEDENNIIYVNLDSYWDNMNDEQLRNFVKHCEENGQTAGIYFSPFVSWWDEYGMQVNYVADTGYTYNDIRLKKADGTYYSNDIDGCYPLDVTHPATHVHFKNQLERLMSLGFKYIKLDFLVHGALEGQHYDENIYTGIQAYNYAMEKITEIVGDDVFINLSIAPIFPYNYANGRRLCCDTYYKTDETEYMLNSLTYGFWQSELYDWIDPDHIVVWGKDAKANERQAKSRVLSGIVTGGSFLAGDNFVNPEGKADKAFARYEELLSNEKLIDVLKIGKPFEGVLSENCPYAADVFTLENEGKTYVAVFNYSKVLIKTKTLDVPENAIVEELFTGKKVDTCNGRLMLTLQPGDSVIYEIVK